MIIIKAGMQFGILEHNHVKCVVKFEVLHKLENERIKWNYMKHTTWHKITDIRNTLGH